MHPHPQEDFHMHCPVENGKARAANGKAHQPRILIDPDLLPNPPKWMRAPNKKGRRSPDKRGCWRRDIKKTLNAQYGYPLPNDDAGRESFALLCHAAFARLSPEDIAQRINWTAAPWADWATRAELDALIDEVANRPRKLTKEIIGRELGLTQDLRMRPDVQAYSLWPIAYTRAQWKLDVAAKARARSARNRAKRRQGKPMPKKAQCIDFLRKTLTYEPAPAARIMRLAVSLGLEKEGAARFGKPMRAACEALGIVRRKIGMGRGWWWGLPLAADRPEAPYISEGALSGEKGPQFSEGALLRSGTKGEPMPEARYDEVAVQAERANERAANDHGRRVGSAVPVHEDERLIAAANPHEPPTTSATQPTIDAAPSFMDGTTIGHAEGGRFGTHRAGEASVPLRLEMIALQRAVLTMQRPPLLIGLRGGGAPARNRSALAASGGLGGWMGPPWVPQRVAGRPDGENRRLA